MSGASQKKLKRRLFYPFANHLLLIIHNLKNIFVVLSLFKIQRFSSKTNEFSAVTVHPSVPPQTQILIYLHSIINFFIPSWISEPMVFLGLCESEGTCRQCVDSRYSYYRCGQQVCAFHSFWWITQCCELFAAYLVEKFWRKSKKRQKHPNICKFCKKKKFDLNVVFEKKARSV